MDKKKLEKRLTIGIQIFAVIGLIIIGFYLGKAYKARKVDNNNEIIKDFGTKMEEFSMESNDKKTIKFDGKDVVVENKNDGVYLNDKKIEFTYAMGGYILDKTLILYSVGQTGSSVKFINKDFDVIPFTEEIYSFSKFELVDGKLQAKLFNNDNGISYRIGNYEVYECDKMESGDLLRKHKDEFEQHRDEILEATVKLSYDGKEIKTEYVEKETVWDRFGKDIEGESKVYCAKSIE